MSSPAKRQLKLCGHIVDASEAAIQDQQPEDIAQAFFLAGFLTTMEIWMHVDPALSEQDAEEAIGQLHTNLNRAVLDKVRLLGLPHQVRSVETGKAKRSPRETTRGEQVEHLSERMLSMLGDLIQTAPCSSTAAQALLLSAVRVMYYHWNTLPHLSREQLKRTGNELLKEFNDAINAKIVALGIPHGRVTPADDVDSTPQKPSEGN